jgi:hypothetical protein
MTAIITARLDGMRRTIAVVTRPLPPSSVTWSPVLHDLWAAAQKRNHASEFEVKKGNL